MRTAPAFALVAITLLLVVSSPIAQAKHGHGKGEDKHRGHGRGNAHRGPAWLQGMFRRVGFDFGSARPLQRTRATQSRSTPRASAAATRTAVDGRRNADVDSYLRGHGGSAP